jgi:hypothetical protein
MSQTPRRIMPATLCKKDQKSKRLKKSEKGLHIFMPTKDWFGLGHKYWGIVHQWDDYDSGCSHSGCGASLEEAMRVFLEHTPHDCGCTWPPFYATSYGKVFVHR